MRALLEWIGREPPEMAHVNNFMEECGCKGVQRNEMLTVEAC